MEERKRRAMVTLEGDGKKKESWLFLDLEAD